MTASREEIFGPVVSLIAHQGEDDAVSIANDSEYGLAGSVFTADTAHGFDRVLPTRIRLHQPVGFHRAVHHALSPFVTVPSTASAAETHRCRPSWTAQFN